MAGTGVSGAAGVWGGCCGAGTWQGSALPFLMDPPSAGSIVAITVTVIVVVVLVFGAAAYLKIR